MRRPSCGVQRDDDLGEREHRVAAEVRVGAVRRLALDHDLDRVARGVHAPGSSATDPTAARGGCARRRIARGRELGELPRASCSAPEGYASSLGWKIASSGAGSSLAEGVAPRARARRAPPCGRRARRRASLAPLGAEGAPVRSAIGSPSSSARTATAAPSPPPTRASRPVPATASPATGQLGGDGRGGLLLGVGELRVGVQAPGAARRAAGARARSSSREQLVERRRSVDVAV